MRKVRGAKLKTDPRQECETPNRDCEWEWRGEWGKIVVRVEEGIGGGARPLAELKIVEQVFQLLFQVISPNNIVNRL